MSEHAQKHFHVYCSRLSDLLQGVQGCQGHKRFLAAFGARQRSMAPAVYYDARSLRLGMQRSWGILVTARRGDEILSAWCVADQELDLRVDRARLAAALAKLETVQQQIQDTIRFTGLVPVAGAYDVPERAFHYQACWPEHITDPGLQGGQV
jgi:hypothetical protein